MANKGTVSIKENHIKIFRWFFYISLIQLLAFFIVPIFLFPTGYVLHINIISALTLGLVVALFFLLVNVCGLYIDKSRRLLYIALLIFIGLWFLWAAISWLYIEHMDYILK